MSSEEPRTAEIDQAYRAFACHLIASVFEDLKSWAVPYANLKSPQSKQLQLEFRKTDLYEIYVFFLGQKHPPEASGLANLSEGMQLQMDIQRVVVGARPMVALAMSEANKFRQTYNLPPYPLI